MPSAQSDPTQRFSSRVDKYVRYRPGYPQELLTVLENEAGLSKASVIADVGSGTGISTSFFLKNGNAVFAVEPNEKMRQAAEARLNGIRGFTSVNGTAEHTTLEAAGVDLVVAAQAFHWFDKPAARKEFNRILKPGGQIVLLWNSRRIDSSPFLIEYEALIQKYATDYDCVNHKNLDETVFREFFAPNGFHLMKLFHTERMDQEHLRGRLLSASYMPGEDDPRYRPMLNELKHIFQKNESKGVVVMEYDTEVYMGNV